MALDLQPPAPGGWLLSIRPQRRVLKTDGRRLMADGCAQWVRTWWWSIAGAERRVVLVPGLQGRHQWMVPTIEALARHGRAISYSLCGEPGTGCRLGSGVAVDVHVDQLDRVLDKARVERAALCGVSFGGWVSVRYAVRRPGRVSALVVASAPGPGFRPDARQQPNIRTPWLLFPACVLSTRARRRPNCCCAAK